MRPAHFFTVDVEEWFQVAALERLVPMSRWERMESRIDAQVDALLGMLDEAGARGTFFTLGWIADRRPAAVCRIAAAGHEIASHGWAHRRVTAMGPREFRDDVRRSREVLQDLCGRPVTGYRAPNFSILPAWRWAFDILLDEGYRYDSSLFPSRHAGLGGHPPRPHRVERTGGTLLEVPLVSARVGPVSVPSAGGAWFRLLPYALTRRALRQAEARGAPGVFYLHPWEIDPGQPRLPAGPATRARHYGGLGATRGRLGRLLAEFRFVSIAEGLGMREDARLPAEVAG
ncbi:MAG TPA: XrtA system polysaccharide deacetylase [Longimicrobium sp.]|nr:XrtA system polysaccharide deacetylase [Longimicrobium sp.]